MAVAPSSALVALSLVIPTYNRADLIAATIDSALAQEIPFTEIIVVDDGSTDDTPSVLAAYGDRLRVLRTENAGVQSARNTGVAAASNGYVCLCDSDDLLQPDFVGLLTGWLAAHVDIDIVYTNFCTFDSGGVHRDKFSLAPSGWFDGARSDGLFYWDVPNLYLRTVRYQPLFPTGVIFKKQFYESLGGYDPRFNRVGGEDWEFTLRSIAAGNVALCARPLTRVRKHGGNDSGNPVRLLMGEAQILEHALANHAAAEPHAEVILGSIEARRLDAFNTAFAAGDFNMTDQLLRLLRSHQLGLRFQMKKWIASLPMPLRDRVWKLTQ